MKNLEIHINCVLIDFEDVQVQINTLVNNILFALPSSDFTPTSSVNYHKNGLEITINDVEDLMESCEVIINNLENYGWLDSVIKIQLNDLLSGRSAYLSQDHPLQMLGVCCLILSSLLVINHYQTVSTLTNNKA